MTKIMKWLEKGSCILFLIMFSNVALSAPVQYEYQVEVNSGQPLFSAGTLVTGSFIYDNESTTVGVPGTTWHSNFGDHTRYGAGVISDFSGSVGGNLFSATDAEILIADATPQDTHPYDGYFIDGGSISHSGLPMSGFTIGDYTLTGFTFFGWGDKTLYTSMDLPVELVPGPVNGGIKLHFQDLAGNETIVTAWTNETLTAVPLPAALFPFASAIFFAGAFGSFRNKKNS